MDDFLTNLEAISPNVNPFESGPESGPLPKINTVGTSSEKSALSETEMDKMIEGKDVLNRAMYSVPKLSDDRTSFKLYDDRYKGFSLTQELVDNPLGLEQLAADTQSVGTTAFNDLVVGATNFAAMFGTAYTGIYDMLKEGSLMPGEGGLTRKIGEFRNSIDASHINFQSQDQSDSPIASIFTTTNGLGELFKSSMFGVGAAIGLGSQALLVSFATKGIGTVPVLANGIRNILQSSKALTSIAQTLNASRQTAQTIKAMSLVNKGVGLAKGLATHYVGAYGEAEFEAMESEEHLKFAFQKDYFDKYNEYASEAEMAKIASVAKQAKDTRFALNAGMLMLTNYALINSVMKPFSKVLKNQENIAAKGFTSLMDKTGIKIVGKYGTEKLAPDANLAAKFLHFGKNTLTPFIKTLATDGKITWSEGFEEGYQFLAGKSTDNYFTNKYHRNNPQTEKDILTNSYKVLEQMYKDKGELTTTEGIKSILTGIIAGSGQQLVSSGFTKLVGMKTAKEDKKAFEASIPQQEQELNTMLMNAINVKSITGTTPQEAIDVLKTTTNINNLQNTVNTSESNELLRKQAQFINAFRGVKMGQINILEEIIERQLDSATLDEFNELTGFLGVNQKTEQEKDSFISGLKTNLHDVKKAVETVETAITNPFKTTDNAYLPFEQMKESLAYHYFMSDQTMKMAEEKLSKSSMLAKDAYVSEMLENKKDLIDQELKSLNAQLDSFQGEGITVSPESKKVVSDIKKKRDAILDYVSSLEEGASITEKMQKLAEVKGYQYEDADALSALSLFKIRDTNKKHVETFRKLSKINKENALKTYEEYVTEGLYISKDLQDLIKDFEKIELEEKIEEVSKGDATAKEKITEAIKQGSTETPEELAAKLKTPIVKSTTPSSDFEGYIDLKEVSDLSKILTGIKVKVDEAKFILGKRILNQPKKINLNSEQFPGVAIMVYDVTLKTLEIHPEFEELVDFNKTLENLAANYDNYKASPTNNSQEAFVKIRQLQELAQSSEGIGMSVAEELAYLIDAVITDKNTSDVKGAVGQAELKVEPVIVPDPILLDLKNIKDFDKLTKEQKNKLKEDVGKQISSLPEDQVYLLHLTPLESDARNIIEKGLRTGVALESTTNLVGRKQYLYESIEAIIDGKLNHKNSSNLIVIAFDRSLFIERVTSEIIFDYLAETHPNFASDFVIPAQYNVGIFTNGVFETNILPKTNNNKINQPVIPGPQAVVLNKLEELKKAYKDVKVVEESNGKESFYNYLGRLYRRVSTAIGNSPNFDSLKTTTDIKNGGIVGDYIDALAREFFKDPQVKFTDIKENSQEKFKNLTNEKVFNTLVKQLSLIKEQIHLKHGKDAKILTDNVFLSKDIDSFKEFAGIAGSPDMLVVDNTGKIHIYDFKNVKNGNEDSLELSYSGKKSKKESWTNQQSVYASLLKNVGEVASIQIVVIPTIYDVEEFAGPLKTEEVEKFVPKPTNLNIKSKLFIYDLEMLSDDKISEFFVYKESIPEGINTSYNTGFEAMLNQELFTFRDGNPVLGYEKNGSPEFTEFLEGWNKGEITLDDLEFIDLEPDTKSKVAPLMIFKGVIISPKDRNNYKALIYTAKETGKKIVAYSFRNPETLVVSNDVLQNLSEESRDKIGDKTTLFNVLKVLENNDIDKQIFLKSITVTAADNTTFENVIPYYTAYNAWIKNGGEKETIQDYFELTYKADSYTENTTEKIPLKDLKHLPVEINGKKFQGIVTNRGVFYEIVNGELQTIEDPVIEAKLQEMILQESPEIMTGNSVLIQVVNAKGVRTNRFEFINNVKKTPNELIKEVYEFWSTVNGENQLEKKQEFQRKYKHISAIQYENIKKTGKPILPDYNINFNSEKNVVTLRIKYEGSKEVAETIVITPESIEFFAGKTPSEGRIYVKADPITPSLEDFIVKNKEFKFYFPMTFGKDVEVEEEIEQEIESEEVEEIAKYSSDDAVKVVIDFKPYSINLEKLATVLRQILPADAAIKEQMVQDTIEDFLNINDSKKEEMIKEILEQEKSPNQKFLISDLIENENNYDIPSPRKSSELEAEVENLIKECNK